ncbi:peptidyl-prolyl isomerase cwc27 [Histoplasma capsulatum G186AR]|uniref:Peptidyl-prolyl isomerase cwc27 n=2 Tax=Ajellomyces capsulatus TaxID=5037 RepID=C0NRM5_AJECG|nr:peptidyl-prolyl isomerase cwc27 [Histoplasma capsulatum G186AR]EEH05541.1 peptidyl-prolyl isomerase cwc27 [Histoplasma capsulatum G186AR]KAG5298708.1 peptidyl-prolyl isomerase cwc27 [Histoplasma capsulatum]QSS67051.1 peptidyl-prolyl isomerase cwc27 [Histoplasma capsulatum G186AR]
MSSHYNTEPPPTASATLITTAGPLHISLFAKQTPLACKNFLQHCLDGYYNGTAFHRVIPDFIIQGGDPTGTGSGGSSIYEDPEFEFDSRDGEKVLFRDEIHSRLRFNRRGLVGMAKAEDGTYGSQFFVTLGSNADRQLTGTCTMFGRIEGDSIYNVVRIAEGDLVEGTERPVYAVKVTGCEVGDLGPFKDVLRKREKVAVAAPQKQEGVNRDVPNKRKKGKGAKVLLSFADDEEEDMTHATQKMKKPKFNTNLITSGEGAVPEQNESMQEHKKQTKVARASPTHKNQADIDVQQLHPNRRRSVSPSKSPPVSRIPTRDPNTQLPLPDPEAPSRSQSSSPDPPAKRSALSRTTAEIDALKASMRRNVTKTTEPTRKKSALDSLIPETSIRGRRRPTSGSTNGAGLGNGTSQDSEAMRMFNAFKARLEQADLMSSRSKMTEKADDSEHANSRQLKGKKPQSANAAEDKKGSGDGEEEKEEEEAEEQVCDLHFIANCQSCRTWDTTAIAAQDDTAQNHGREDDDNPIDWMTHRLTFGKDMLGKDLNWKRTHEDVDGLVVIDPREKEKEVGGGGGAGRRRERERQRKLGSGHRREWDGKGR